MTEKEFYSQKDSSGNVGEKGMVKSYELGWDCSVENWKLYAKENYSPMTFEQFLIFWFNEVRHELQFTWQKLGSGYGYHGNTILEYENVIFKDIYGQLLIDEHFKV